MNDETAKEIFILKQQLASERENRQALTFFCIEMFNAFQNITGADIDFSSYGEKQMQDLVKMSEIEDVSRVEEMITMVRALFVDYQRITKK